MHVCVSHNNFFFTQFEYFIARPCQRCIKRDLATTCTDGARKKAKYLQDAEGKEIIDVFVTIADNSFSLDNMSITSNDSRYTQLSQIQQQQQLLDSLSNNSQQPQHNFLTGGTLPLFFDL